MHSQPSRGALRWRLSLGVLLTAVLAACGGDDDSGSSSVWPADHALTDPNRYAAYQDPQAALSAAYRSGPNGGAGSKDVDVANASLAQSAVDETPATKHHRAVINGQTIEYTARAGHLIAWAPKNPNNPAQRDAEASIFYMSYTRDDIPHAQRPVTFIFNGGPGEPSIWMHLGAWAPKRLKIDAPNLPAGPNIPDSFPLIDNPQSLLDQTDLVYVDIAGSGFSEAIAPHKNQDFWSTDADAGIFRDFITAYINRYNRQSSPKYLFGESYSGIRTPIVADLLVQAGTSNYAPDPSGAKPIVLSGMVLQSPILDYGYLSTQADAREGFFPTVGMVVDFYGKSTARGVMTEPQYADYLRNFTTAQYAPGLAASNFPPATISQLSAITGLPASTQMKDWLAIDPNGLLFNSVASAIYPNAAASAQFNAYDGRISTTANIKYDISSYENAGFYGAIKPLLLDQFGYRNQDPTQIYGSDIAFNFWNWNAPHRGSTNPSSVPDLAETLTLDPSVKVLVIHGYHDGVTPFFQTELDLQHGGVWPAAGQTPRITVKEYDGGHMAYLTEASRDPMRADLRQFYNASAPATAVARQQKAG